MTQVLFQSQNQFYKFPFGAVNTRQKISMRFLVSFDTYVHKVSVILRKNEHSIAYDFVYEKTQDDYNRFICEFEMPREGVYFYRFEVHTDWGVLYVGKDEDNNAVIGDFLPEWQLTVYKSSYKTPDLLKGGLVYQIFCDRFCSKGKIPSPRYGTLKKWTDEVGDTDNNGVYHADDFFGGNFSGIESKLDYIKDLGATAVYLSPIFRSNSNHRYDTADYSHIDEMLGGEKGFESLLLSAKKKGLEIILDGVFNHTGSDSVYFNKLGHFDSVGAYQSKDSPYHSWYTFYDFPDDYNCWWGIGCVPTIARDATGFHKMIEEDVLSYWTKKGVAGWRLDVVDELSDQFLDGIRTAIKKTNDNAVVIGEVWEDASTKESYGEKRRYFEGDQLDGVLNYVYKDAILKLLSDGDGKAFVRTVMQIAENYPKDSLDTCWTLIDSHDTFRAINVLSGALPPENKSERKKYRLTEEEFAWGIQGMKIASCLQYFLPGVPCLYYGDEVGLEGFEDPFNRRPFPWDNMHKNLLDHYKMLGALRKSHRQNFIGLPDKIYADNDTVTLVRNNIKLTVNPLKRTFFIDEQ